MIIGYRIGWLRVDSLGASSHTIVGVHGKWRSEMRVHGVYEPPWLIGRRSGGIECQKTTTTTNFARCLKYESPRHTWRTHSKLE
jgi:hypothetical protein